jgi:hypothetical protein
MSALGQKQTFAPQKVMSALPSKADITRRIWRLFLFGVLAGKDRLAIMLPESHVRFSKSGHVRCS